jgi:hypothetical protein
MPVILATQEDCGLKPDRANSLREPNSKIPDTNTKMAGGVAQVKALSSSPRTEKKKKKSEASFPIALQKKFKLLIFDFTTSYSLVPFLFPSSPIEFTICPGWPVLVPDSLPCHMLFP